MRKHGDDDRRRGDEGRVEERPAVDDEKRRHVSRRHRPLHACRDERRDEPCRRQGERHVVAAPNRDGEHHRDRRCGEKDQGHQGNHVGEAHVAPPAHWRMMSSAALKALSAGCG